MYRFARLALVVSMLSVVSCLALRAEEIVALTVSNKLLRFDSTAPGTITSTVQVTNLQASENLLGIDFRPNTGQLFAVGSTSRVYRIDVTTGVATSLSAAPFAPLLSGARFGIDFNPTVDRIRCCSEVAQNLRLSPINGTVAGTDTVLAYDKFDPLFGIPPHIVSTAYTNNNQYASSTTLYAIDATQDALVTIGSLNSSVSPNGGQVFTVGKLGVDTTDFAGFDISGQTGVAYASLTSTGSVTSALYTLNLSTGTATLVGAIGGGEIIADISVATPPISYDLVVLDSGGALRRLESRTPSLASVAVAGSGLAVGETLREIAFRPLNSLLYAIGSASNIYTVETSVATKISAAPLSTLPTSFNMGFAFDPVADKIRIVNDMNQNLVVDPTTGAIASVDTTLAYAPADSNVLATPSVVALAYTNQTAGAATTTLYGIDQALDILVTIPTPSSGLLTTVGALGVNASTITGFDIAPSGIAFAAINNALYTIDLTTGAATAVPAGGAGTLIGGAGVYRSVAAVIPSTAPVLQFTTANFAVTEGSPGVLTVTRTGSNSNGNVSVDYVTTSGSAIAGTNFTAVSGTLTFLSGETSRTISVPTLNDNKLDLFLTATVTLSNPVGATLGAQTSATLTIADINDSDGDGFSNAVEAAAGTDPLLASSTPFGGAAAGATVALDVTKLGVKLNFAKPTLSDSVSFAGTVPNPLTTIAAGTKFYAEVGDVNGTPGVILVFTADSKGKFSPKGLTLAKPKNGVSKYSVSASKGTFAALLSNAGLTNASVSKVAKMLNYNVYFNSVTYGVSKKVTYTATLGKSGSAALAK